MDSESIEVRHFGNTANNAYFNWVLLRQFGQLTNLPLVTWTRHSLAAPAWEELDFENPSEGFLEDPDWSEVPGAEALHKSCMVFSDGTLGYEDDRKPGSLLRRALFLAARGVYRAFQRLLAVVHLQSCAGQPSTPGPLAASIRRMLTEKWRANRHSPSGSADPRPKRIEITYGCPVFSDVRRHEAVNVALEHGTLRWIRFGSAQEAHLRVQYRNFLETSDHVWVTNLDDATLELADEILGDKWAALPHPYRLDPQAPYDPNPEMRPRLVRETQSEFLILLPASINWMSDHDKGSLVALSAFIELRRLGYPVGLVLTSWGRQVEAARAMLARARVANHAYWMRPQPRIRLQRVMGAADVVLDQFGYPAFGGIAVKTMEQATPLISRSLNPRAVALMGERPPWLGADTLEDVVEHCRTLIADAQLDSPSLRTSIGAAQRSWILRRHHHEFTQLLQAARYQELLSGKGRGGPPAIHWSELPDHGSEAWHHWVKGHEVDFGGTSGCFTPPLPKLSVPPKAHPASPNVRSSQDAAVDGLGRC